MDIRLFSGKKVRRKRSKPRFRQITFIDLFSSSYCPHCRSPLSVYVSPLPILRSYYFVDVYFDVTEYHPSFHFCVSCGANVFLRSSSYHYCLEDLYQC